MQIIIALLLLAILIVLAPWVLGIVVAAATLWAIVAAVVAVGLLCIGLYFGIDMARGSEWARQRRIRKTIERANRRNRQP